MASFSSSSACVASASAVNFMAGGPVGMSIMVNHRTGSWPRNPVLDATVVMMVMLTLRRVSMRLLYRDFIEEKRKKRKKKRKRKEKKEERKRRLTLAKIQIE